MLSLSFLIDYENDFNVFYFLCCDISNFNGI